MHVFSAVKCPADDDLGAATARSASSSEVAALIRGVGASTPDVAATPVFVPSVPLAGPPPGLDMLADMLAVGGGEKLGVVVTSPTAGGIGVPGYFGEVGVVLAGDDTSGPLPDFCISFLIQEGKDEEKNRH